MHQVNECMRGYLLEVGRITPEDNGWETTVVEVFHGGRSRRSGPPSVTLQVPTVKYNGKSYYEYYPPKYDDTDPPECIRMPLFKGGCLMVEQLHLETSEESETGVKANCMFETIYAQKTHTR